MYPWQVKPLIAHTLKSWLLWWETFFLEKKMAGADNFDEGVLTLTHNWAVLVEALYYVFQFDQEILTKKSFLVSELAGP